jgi:hypothetical protein
MNTPNKPLVADPLSLVFIARLGFNWGCLWAAQAGRWAADFVHKNRIPFRPVYNIKKHTNVSSLY